MRLYFIRHGESTSNFNNLMTGRVDALLTERGQDQAREAGRAVVSQAITFDLIISSPLVRAYSTAQLIAEEIGYLEENVQVNDLVIERSFGLLEGKSRSEFGILTDGLVKEYGGELESEVIARAQMFLDSLRGTSGNVLIVSHTVFGRCLRSIIEGIPFAESENFKNADLTDLGDIVT